MIRFKQLAAIVLAAFLIVPPLPVEAKGHKGDRLRNQAREEEMKGNFDHALEIAEQALAQDPSDPSYLLEVRRLRFEAGGAHVRAGQKLRANGQLEQALAEFEKAWGIDPASDIAAQEARRTREMIQREKNGGQPPAASITPEEQKTLTPSELAHKRSAIPNGLTAAGPRIAAPE